MGVEDLGRWHWVVLGVLAGLLMGGARLVWREDPAGGGAAATTPILTQAVFERELLQHAADGAPRLDRLVVYPADADGRTWVTGERLVPTFAAAGAAAAPTPQLAYEPFRFPARSPYRPLLNAPPPAGPQFTVADYLAEVRASHPDAAFAYRRAWWATTAGTMGLWTAGGALAIGGVWPVLLNLLIGAGFGRPRNDRAVHLAPVRHEPPAPPAGGDPAAQRRLEALEQEMLDNLADGAPAAPAPTEPTAATPAVSPPPALDAGPVEPQTADEPVADPKAFGGEFYPTTYWGPADPGHDGDEPDQEEDDGKRKGDGR